MSQIYNIYLLSRKTVLPNDLFKIISLVSGVPQKVLDLYEHKAKNKQPLKLDLEIDEFEIKYRPYDWFIGDEGYFFDYEYEKYKNKEEIKFGEFGEEELTCKKSCPNCYNEKQLQQKVLDTTLDYFLRGKDIAIELPLEPMQKGISCPQCGTVLDLEYLLERQVIGNFRMLLPFIPTNPHYGDSGNLGKIRDLRKGFLDFLNKDEKNKNNFYYDHYLISY